MAKVHANPELVNECGAHARACEAAGDPLPLVERLSSPEATDTAQGDAERLYRLLWETTTDAVLIIDSSSIIRFANPSAMQVFGHLPASLINVPLAQLQPERIRDVHEQGMKRYLESPLALPAIRGATFVAPSCPGRLHPPAPPARATHLR